MIFYSVSIPLQDFDPAPEDEDYIQDLVKQRAVYGDASDPIIFTTTEATMGHAKLRFNNVTVKTVEFTFASDEDDAPLGD